MSNSLCKNNSRNNAIDLFRYLCALMVVIIHSTFWQNMGSLGFFIGNIFPRIAVPFFFATSGYFYIKKLSKGEHVFLKQIKHILITYTLWSAVYFSVDFFNQIILDKAPILPFMKNFLISFFINGSAGHFWYFPALVVAVCLVTVFYKLKIEKLLLPISAVMFIIGCMGCSYFELCRNIPVIGNLFELESFNIIRRYFLMAFPLFSIGYLLLKLEKKTDINNKKPVIALILAMAVYFCEITAVIYFSVYANLILTLGLYPLLAVTMFVLLSNPLPKCSKFAKPARTIANITYYSHPLFQLFAALFSKFTHIEIPNILVFAYTVAITFILGLLCHFLAEKKKIKIVKTLIG